MLTSPKLRGSDTTYVSYLFTKFQVSSIIQRVSDMGIALSPPLPPQQNETLKKC